MLQAYLVSICIWMIIIFCAAVLFAETIKQKGWIDSGEHAGFFDMWFKLFCMSAVPLLRIVFLLTIIFMSAVSKEEYEEMKKKIDHDKL